MGKLGGKISALISQKIALTAQIRQYDSYGHSSLWKIKLPFQLLAEWTLVNGYDKWGIGDHLPNMGIPVGIPVYSYIEGVRVGDWRRLSLATVTFCLFLWDERNFHENHDLSLPECNCLHWRSIAGVAHAPGSLERVLQVPPAPLGSLVGKWL